LATVYGRIQACVQERVTSGHQRAPWIGLLRRDRFDRGRKLHLLRVHDRLEQGLLVTEVMIQRAARYAREANYFFGRGLGIAPFSEKLARDPEQATESQPGTRIPAQ